MTERISSQLSGPVCRHPDDEPPEAVSQERECRPHRDKPISEEAIDWDHMATMCSANTLLAVRKASGARGSEAPQGETPPQESAPKAPARGPGPRFGLDRKELSVVGSAAVVKGVTKEGMETEVASGSIRLGLQNEAKLTLARVGAIGEHLGAAVETMTLTAHGGFLNSDGSRGINYGVSANFIAGEVRAERSGNRLTLGLGAGVSLGGHIGIRDADGDGRPEICARGSIGPVDIGGCIETPVVIRP